MLVSIFRVFKFAFHNFWRNIWLSLVTVSIITLSLLSINFFILANSLVDTSLEAIENKVNISIDFKLDAPESVIFALKDKLAAMPEVATVDYVSKQHALDLMKERYEKAGNATITDSLKELDNNPLFASILVKAHSIEDYPTIMNALNTGEYDTYIERKNFDDRRVLIQKITMLKERIKQVGLVINLFFIAITALIVFNTIRITIYTRREEIGIMKLVGAASWFVRTPLIIEGMLYSLVSISLTIMILLPILGMVQPYADRIFDGQALNVFDYFFGANSFKIFGYQLLASIALNTISSSLAIGRYLRV